MTEEILLALYNEYHKNFGSTLEYQEAEETLCDINSSDGRAELFVAAVSAETELAFKSGFYAAINLLIHNDKK